VSAPSIDLSFPRHWQAEVLPSRPLILPTRHFVYPRQAEEVERGALEILVHPAPPWPASATGSLPPGATPFLATCALGFRDPLVPSGLWSFPNPGELCAVSGGYGYLIDTDAPQRFTMLACRPVLEVLPLPGVELLLFVGHRGILAWGAAGQAWESGKLSDEGVAITRVEDSVLLGRGWSMMSDEETEFSLDLRTGTRIRESGPSAT
jgi:hypothetical protein